MTRYNYFEQLNELTRMEQTADFKYNKMIQTGQLDFWDYGTGYIDLCIYYLYQNDNHICRIWFGTIDDGDFGCWKVCKNEKAAKNLVKKAVKFFTPMITFPTKDTLNLELNKIGLHVDYE